MTHDPLVALIERAERLLAKKGVRMFELCASEDQTATIEAMDGEIHAEESSGDRSIGVRVIDVGIGFAALSEGDDTGMERAIEAALAEAKRVRPAKMKAPAGPAKDVETEPFLDARATGRPRPLLGEHALALEAKTIEASRGIARVRPASVSEVIGRMRLRTSAGLDVEERYSRAFATVGAVAEGKGDQQMAYAGTSSASLEGLNLDRIAKRAADKATRRLGARGFKTAIVPLVLDAEVVADLLDVFLSALAGDAIERGASFLNKGIGAKVVSEAITVVDRPHDPDLDGHSWYDGEGLATAERLLIDRGRIACILDDLESAARAGRQPLGHAQRSSALSRPHPGAHAPHLSPGTLPLEQLLRRAEGGLYVHELAGVHTINEVTGVFSLGASGWRIGEGSLGEPVEGVTISGSLLELLGSDPEPSKEAEVHGGARVPALFLPGVQVASAD